VTTEDDLQRIKNSVLIDRDDLVRTLAATMARGDA